MTTRRLVLVRHADAVSRRSFDAPDVERPLTSRGARQAEALAGTLPRVGRLAAASSPARRCVDTLTPFAQRAGLPVHRVPFLAEGTSPEESLAALLDDLAALEDTRATGERVSEQRCRGLPSPVPTLVACTHGDVLSGIVAVLEREGVPLDVLEGTAPSGVVLETPKAARWELDVVGHQVLVARLVGPPELAGLA